MDSLPLDAKRALLAQAERAISLTRLTDYKPYGKQREFHRAGASFRERLLMAANQVGKTLSAGGETAMHATGRYPNWWDGRVFTKPIVGWFCGVTGEKTKDGPQRTLFGRENAIGTGMIAADAIKDYTHKRGIANAIDTAIIRFGGGGDVQAGESILTSKSYDQGEAKFASETLHLVWNDEEPPIKVYTEGLTRTNTTNGIVYTTFTPMLGHSTVVLRFIRPEANDLGKQDRHVTKMTIHDAEHFTPEERQRIINSYPDYERAARTMGEPILGSGRIFPLDEAAIKIQAFAIPSHWPRLVAIDFGWDHPTAIVWLAWDRDTDTIYVTDCYRQKEGLVPVHASVIRAKGQWMPVSWPHDGNNDTAAGPQLAQQYRDAGVNMRHENAKFAAPSDDKQANPARSLISVEAGVTEMLNRMMQGQFKVFEHLHDWFEEFRSYHRKDGKIVKEQDDLLSATRYGMMDIRFAIVQPVTNKINPNRPYNWRA